MFDGRLAFDDLASPLVVTDGGIFLGKSRLDPVRHRLLRTVVLESDVRVMLVSSERFADNPPGLHVAPRMADDALSVEVEALTRSPFDVAVLTIDRRERAVCYRASPLVSIPLYLIADDDGIAFDWDYARLLRGRDCAPVWDIALAQIAGRSTYGTRTIAAGVCRATAGATLVARAGGVESAWPDSVAHDGPGVVAEGTDVTAQLLDTVTALIAARPLDRARTAVELSGGMDSALTALAAAQAMGPGLMSIGAQFDGAMGAAQARRRAALIDRGGFDDLAVPAERFAPFASPSLRRMRHGVWPEDENYPELFEAMFGVLRAAGIDALISGFGGDELYLTYQDEEPAARTESERCMLLTDHGVALADRACRPYPRGWLQETCWQSAASQSQRVLRYGLWPVYPYHNVALARFVSRLPYRYRQQRALLRDTLAGLLGDTVFEADYAKETFDPVAMRGIVENRDYLIELFVRSPLSRHPGIDRAAVDAALRGDPADLPRSTFNALFHLLKIASFFQ